ncbi:LOW QUALITY PROTEIN: centrosomal protein of 68 kDa [Lithobates pipiens]
MDSSTDKDFLSRRCGYQPLYNTGHYSLRGEPTNKTLDENDDFEQDQLRTFNDSSWSYCDISSAQSKGAYNSLSSNFNRSADFEKHSQKPQTLQEQYWACAIPNTPPPRPDRDSPNWNPDKEYQDLLDYTYPLNSKCFLNKGNEDAVTDEFLQDSGVDIGSYNLSCESKFDSFGSSYREDNKLKISSSSHTKCLKSPNAFSTPLCRRTGYQQSVRNPSKSSPLTFYGDFSPYTSKIDLAKESTESFCLPKYNVFDKLTTDRPTREGLQKPGQFLASTSVLTLQGDLDSDEEYLSLPSSLKELDALATHLKDLSLGVGQAGSTNCDQNNASKQTLNLAGIDVDQELLDSLNSRTTAGDDFKDISFVCQLSTCQKHNDSDMKRFSSLRDMLDGGNSSLVELIRCPSMPNIQENKSLVQKIQNFCVELDKLIQWLYSVAEVTNNWTAPKPSMESIQLSLSLYLKLKKDVAEQRTLANAILKEGESLAKCMAVNSSVLKDTLALISKQSGELERHTERLYASVLEAMDTITDKGLGRNSNPKQPVSLEMESS